MSADDRRTRRIALLATLSVAIGILATFAFMELVLRFLPVREGLGALPVNAQQPYLHFTPQREVVFSIGWDFRLVNKIRVNNFGFVNAQDYSPTARSPLLTVIGDSYVEAAMVSYPDTIHGRLASALSGRGRVYSFGASGAQLSQYLAYARYARDTFRPDGLVIVVVGNDFDEALAEYKSAGGFHYLAEDSNGSLRLRLEPLETPLTKRIARRSALVRYMVHNINVTALRIPSERSRRYVGNVLADADGRRITRSIAAIDYFLEMLPAFSGIAPSNIAIVVDGMRPDLYDELTLKTAGDSYFAQMRSQLLDRGRRLGYVMIDMQPRLIARHARDGARFEWPFDGHWNSVGHEEAAAAVLESGLPQRIFARPNDQPGPPR
jgi:hypothetical protein